MQQWHGCVPSSALAAVDCRAGPGAAGETVGVADGASTFELDHVVIAVDDLARVAGALSDRYGLESVDGGRHPAWGTANRIVPAGDAYLELITVVDRDRDNTNGFGRWVAGALAEADAKLLGWAVRTTSIEIIAQRLGLAVNDGSRSTDDGRVLRWQLAGVPEAIAVASLPFFIQWD